MSIAKEGFPFILIPMGLGFLLVYFGRIWIIPGSILIILGLFCLYFFRDPCRVIPEGENLVISPADGRVMEVSEENGKKVIRIFLSVFNVHLQRAPFAGEVTSVVYKPGKFLPAMDVTAHIVNDQNVITIKTAKGDFIVKQISGILARRVVSWVKPQDKVEKGQKIGIIKFGSQVDIIMPASVEVSVKKDDITVGGKTIIGIFVD